MIKLKCAEMNGDKLVKYTSIGCYPVFYLTEDSAVMCADCANGENGSDAQTQDDPQWNIVAADANWEDPALHCEHCSARIESAYAEDDAEHAWRDDAVQFPRLLAEITATQENLDFDALAQSMDLSVEHVIQLFDRAGVAWEKIKAQK